MIAPAVGGIPEVARRPGGQARGMRILVCVACVACSTASHERGAPDATAPDTVATIDAPAAVVPYPDPDWPTGTPESQGLDTAKLDEAAAAADSADSYCLLVIRHGVLVSEHYFHDATASSTPSSWSIAKSYTSTVVGIALANHDLPDLDANVSDFVPTWAGSPRQPITLRNLVTMTSGLQWSIFQDYIAMAEFAPDKSAFAVGIDASDPVGSKWLYHNGGVQVIEPLFRAATGTSIEDYARTHLWSKIGMTATWGHDLFNHPTTYANVLATCRDHARLGYLYLHHGRWKDEQVVPANWIAAATTPSQAFNRGYGYLWWLNGQGPTISSTGSQSATELYDYTPADLFAARGFGGQFIDVIPSLDMVVVRFGKDPTAITSTDPAVIAAALIADETTDRHRSILVPILAAVH